MAPPLLTPLKYVAPSPPANNRIEGHPPLFPPYSPPIKLFGGPGPYPFILRADYSTVPSMYSLPTKESNPYRPTQRTALSILWGPYLFYGRPIP